MSSEVIDIANIDNAFKSLRSCLLYYENNIDHISIQWELLSTNIDIPDRILYRLVPRCFMRYMHNKQLSIDNYRLANDYNNLELMEEIANTIIQKGDDKRILSLVVDAIKYKDIKTIMMIINKCHKCEISARYIRIIYYTFIVNSLDNLKMLQLLLDHRVRCRDVLERAIELRKIEAARLMLSYGVRSDNMLGAAIRTNDVEVVRWIIGYDPIIVCALKDINECNNIEIIQLLRCNGIYGNRRPPIRRL
jgi:hypothetical protein